jgi:hypothetical protein
MRRRGANRCCTGSQEEGSAPVRSHAPLLTGSGAHRESIGVGLPAPPSRRPPVASYANSNSHLFFSLPSNVLLVARTDGR